MLYANVSNALHTLVVGHTNVTWDQSNVYNETFLETFTPQQLAVLVFDVFGRIFLSYDLHPPDDYEDLLHKLADGVVPNNEETYIELVNMLVTRFVISAVYYQVAAVYLCRLNLLMF
jgi:hypothetical protein